MAERPYPANGRHLWAQSSPGIETNEAAEIATAQQLPIRTDGSLFLYAAWPGRPALGPSQRIELIPPSGVPGGDLNPRWLDGGDLASGVLTLGLHRGPWMLEASSFNAQDAGGRYGDRVQPLDDWSTRLSYHATPRLTMQLSMGRWQTPAMAQQSTAARRLTASATYQGDQGPHRLRATVAWGINEQQPSPRIRLPGWLLESAYVLRQRHTFFGRIEDLQTRAAVTSGGLIHGHAVPMSQLSVGYLFDSLRAGTLNLGVGAFQGIYSMPRELDPRYGSRPSSYLIFLQGRI